MLAKDLLLAYQQEAATYWSHHCNTHPPPGCLGGTRAAFVIHSKTFQTIIKMDNLAKKVEGIMKHNLDDDDDDDLDSKEQNL